MFARVHYFHFLNFGHELCSEDGESLLHTNKICLQILILNLHRPSTPDQSSLVSWRANKKKYLSTDVGFFLVVVTPPYSEIKWNLEVPKEVVVTWWDKQVRGKWSWCLLPTFIAVDTQGLTNTIWNISIIWSSNASFPSNWWLDLASTTKTLPIWIISTS